MLYQHFTTRQQYETSAIHIINGIWGERPGSKTRRFKESALSALQKEMRERFPIPTYRVEWLDGERWVPSKEGCLLNQAEYHIARLQGRRCEARMVQDGIM